MSGKKSAQMHLRAGDVLRTNPSAGFWGCAIVLTNRDETQERGPMCHIGITTVVLDHDYSFDELDVASLKILEFDRNIRTGPNMYKPLRREKCIGIYSSKVTPYARIIGQVDATGVYHEALTWEVGDGANGGWPLCGPVAATLGNEAVIAWRRVYDREEWEKELKEARRSHEILISKLAVKEGIRRKKARERT